MTWVISILGILFFLFISVVLYRMVFTPEELDIDSEMEAWKHICKPLDNLLDEYKYFCNHGKFPDNTHNNASILFTEKCPAPLKLFGGIGNREIGQFDEILAHYREEIKTVSYKSPSLKAKFYAHECPNTDSITLVYSDKGKQLEKTISKSAIQDDPHILFKGLSYDHGFNRGN